MGTDRNVDWQQSIHVWHKNGVWIGFNKLDHHMFCELAATSTRSMQRCHPEDILMHAGNILAIFVFTPSCLSEWTFGWFEGQQVHPELKRQAEEREMREREKVSQESQSVSIKRPNEKGIWQLTDAKPKSIPATDLTPVSGAFMFGFCLAIHHRSFEAQECRHAGCPFTQTHLRHVIDLLSFTTSNPPVLARWRVHISTRSQPYPCVQRTFVQC